MSSVKQYIDELMNRPEIWNEYDTQKQQVNVRIDSTYVFLLEKLAERLKLSRAAFAADLMERAIWDACYAAEFTRESTTPDGEKIILPPIYDPESPLHDEYRAYMAKHGSPLVEKQ
jgi:hypothetical protein